MLVDSKQELSTILELHHEDYSIYVTAPTARRTFEKAQKLIGLEAMQCEYRWNVSARLFVSDLFNNESELHGERLDANTYAAKANALFFENTEYQCEIVFNSHLHVKKAELAYPFFLDERGEIQPRDSFLQRRQILQFSLNYGNEIGQSDIIVNYHLKNGSSRSLSFHFDVISAKLDYHKDLKLIVESIEKEYTLLSLSFLRKTYQTFSEDMSRDETPDVIWWNIFKRIQKEFCRASSMVIDRPHNRLKLQYASKRYDQLRRVTPQIENEIEEYKNEERHLYRTEIWELNDDTNENRFVKFAIVSLLDKFLKLKDRILSNNKNLPKSYVIELDETEKQLQRLKSSPFLRRIGKFTGLRGENLTLKQATGYSTIYRDWLLLQNTYDLHDGLLQIELKDIAQLYEIWCFIEVKNVVRRLLSERTADKNLDNISQLIPEGSTDFASITPEFVKNLKQGAESKVLLREGNVTLAEIIYNAQMSKTEKTNEKSGLGENIGSLTVPQRPDIVLRLTKRDVEKGLEMTYLFDAKYRLDVDDNNHQTPPDDTINQMHRYRDAIYYSDNAYKDVYQFNNLNIKKEVLGGYILFPGIEPKEPEKENYLNSIKKVNIGAFPLRPDKNNAKEGFLRTFLDSILSKDQDDILLKSIPQRGLFYTLNEPKETLFFLATPTPEVNENVDSFLEGKAVSFVTSRKGYEVIKDINAVKYYVPVVNHKSTGYYKIDSIALKSFQNVEPQLRLEFTLKDFVRFPEGEFKFGLDKVATKGKIYTKEQLENRRTEIVTNNFDQI